MPRQQPAADYAARIVRTARDWDRIYVTRPILDIIYKLSGAGGCDEEKWEETWGYEVQLAYEFDRALPHELEAWASEMEHVAKSAAWAAKQVLA